MSGGLGLHKINQRIKDLQSILEATKLLNSSHDIDYILEELMHTTLRLLDRADIGVIFLYDKMDGYLKSKVSFGFNNISINLKPGESITGMTFNQKKTMHLKSHEEMISAMANMYPDNKNMLNSRISKPLNMLQSSISCPLIYEDECIGVFVLDNYSGKDPLNSDDVYLAELISVQATIAVKNAEKYRNELENQIELRKYSDIIELEKNRYQYSTYLHNKFTEMILNKSTVNDIVKEVSILLQIDVFIIDLFYTISSYSGDFNVSKDFLINNKHQFSNYMKLDEKSIHYSDSMNFWVMLYPVSVADEVLCWLGVILQDSLINELDMITIEKCSTIIALDIMKSNEISMLEQSMKGDFLDNLLSSSNPEFIKNFSKRYHLDLNNPHILLMLKLDFSVYESQYYKLIKFLYEEISSLAIKSFNKSLTILRSNYVIIIVEKGYRLDNSELLAFHKIVLERFNQMQPILRVKVSFQTIISETISNYNYFRSVFNRTIKLFELIPMDKPNGECYFYEDFEIRMFLLKNDKEDLTAFVNRYLSPLLSYSNSSKKELMETLSVYIKNGGNWTSTKNQMHIHGNTLTYRLNRIQELLDMDLSDYSSKLKIQIALEILSIYPELKK